jgi:hypothetical protein
MCASRPLLEGATVLRIQCSFFAHPEQKIIGAARGAATPCERENLTGDAKGKGASGANRETENTDAPERGGLPCSSDEAG